jgi:hypothetical protein
MASSSTTTQANGGGIGMVHGGNGLMALTSTMNDIWCHTAAVTLGMVSIHIDGWNLTYPA